MMLQCFVVRDIRAGSFGNPQFVVSIGGAMRSFSDEVNRVDKDNIMFHHAEDFELYQLGTFDTETCGFSLLELPKLLLRGSDVRVKS